MKTRLYATPAVKGLNKDKFCPKFITGVKTLYVDYKIIFKTIHDYLRKFRCLEEYDRVVLYPLQSDSLQSPWYERLVSATLQSDTYDP